MVEMIKAALEGAAHQVITAYNGQEGLNKARKEKPEAIVLDIMMPVKDGFVACKELKEDPALRNIPVLILTAVSEHFANTRYAKSMGLDLDAEDYIDKPVDPKLLLVRLNKLLKN
jgi:two-component system alkaline phosphatase synthesis response regulator PhoP